MPIQQKCKILKAEKLNDFAHCITLSRGELSPQVGQFLQVKCGDGFLLRRPISICAWNEESIQLVFEVRGEGTAWLARQGAGHSLDVLGPLGHGFQVEEKGKYLLVGGGIGVPPLLACAQKAGGNCTAILGFRDREHAMLTEEFSWVCRYVRVATDDGSLGYHGFVNSVAEEILAKDNSFTAILACGPKPMLRSLARLGEEKGIPCQVSMEERMGCGVGACLVCACDMADGSRKHVCKNGPVFDAKEVDWNG